LGLINLFALWVEIHVHETKLRIVYTYVEHLPLRIVRGYIYQVGYIWIQPYVHIYVYMNRNKRIGCSLRSKAPHG